MATWVTHLMVADQVMKEVTGLDRRGFCVGNIAPDCNVENEDWTSYTPPREVTHWMRGERKAVADGDLFYEEYIWKRKDGIKSEEQYSFLLGYYVHLITDATFQRFIRDESRVKAVWNRMKADILWKEKADGYLEDWDSVRKVIPKEIRMNEIYTMEAEYLNEHPDSGYLTEIVPLKEFPDYIDYLPHGSIVRKIKIMGQIPKVDDSVVNPVSISREEYHSFVEHTVNLVLCKLKEKKILEVLSKAESEVERGKLAPIRETFDDLRKELTEG